MSVAASPSPSPQPSAATTPRRVYLHLVLCICLAFGVALGQAWGLGAAQRWGVRSIEIQLDRERLDTQIRILSAWFQRSKRRRRYSRREALLILEHGERFCLSAAQLARDFLVSAATLYRWRKWRRDAPPGTNPWPGSTPKPVPPCRRICDNRRQLVADMALASFESDRGIVRHLLHLGERVSARSVRRFRAQPLAAPQQPRKPAPQEPPQLIEACARHVSGPKHWHRPRLARLLRILADAFFQGIAADTHRRLDELVDTADPARSVYEQQEARLRARRADQLAILHSLMARIAPGHRPHYTAAERAAILDLKSRYRLSNKTLAEWFLLDPGTLSEWTCDVDRPEQRARPLVLPLPDTHAAIASVAEGLRCVPKRLRQAVQDALASLAAKVPMRRPHARRPKRDASRREPATPSKRKRARIRARYPNHYWSSDLTIIQLGRQFYLATILDMFSRDVLAWELFDTQPTSEQIETLFQHAVSRYGNPKHFVSDQGGQFLGKALQAALAAHGVDHRKGAVGQHGSIAVTERSWRTIKELLGIKTFRPNVPQILYQRVAVVIDYYRSKRPHTALGAATPAETYRCQPRAAAHAKPMPRGWRGETAPAPAFVICHALPLERKLPYLQRIA